LRDSKNIMLDCMRLASLKVEKYGNEKMYQLGGKMAEGADDVIATFKGVEVAGDGTVIGKQVGPGKITEWVNKHHAGSSNKINDEIQGIEASLAKGTGNRDADIPPVAKAQIEIEYMLARPVRTEQKLELLILNKQIKSWLNNLTIHQSW